MTVGLPVIADVLAAAHLTHRVASAFPDRGGIFFVSYPGSLKSSLIKTLKQFPDARVFSDLNQQQMKEMRDALCQGKVRTVAFDEFNKLYQRNAATSENLEGTISAVVAQGWSAGSFESQDVVPDEARCLVVGGLTRTVYENKIKRWKENGFARRFLWCFYKLADATVIGNAIRDQRPIDIYGEVWPQVYSEIPFELEMSDRDEIRDLLTAQEGSDGTPYDLMMKIAVVLRWHYQKIGMAPRSRVHMAVIREFCRMCGRGYAELVTDERPVRFSVAG